MKDPREISRADAARMGNEALQISQFGEYLSPSHQRISIVDSVHECVNNTEEFPPQRKIPLPTERLWNTEISVDSRSTLEVLQQLVAVDPTAAALNFASARNPGGGFLNGARAQEESLCRASALYLSLQNCEMYSSHRSNRDLLYSHWLIHSPDVPFFRAESGELLETPWLGSIVSVPAPNSREALARDHSRHPEIETAFRERIERMLSLFAQKGHRSIVLGAWGCGAFGGDATIVARLFQQHLQGLFSGVFQRVVFAILDTRSNESNIGPFRELFEVRSEGVMTQ